MNIFLVIFLLLLSLNNVFAQTKDGSLTVTVANTVLNRYTRVTADVLAGTNTVTVTNINELNRDGITYTGLATNAAGFVSNALAAGDLIMLYQAQGAIIDATNTINYGAVTNYNGAGSYELATVSSVSGNVITLTCNTRLSYYAARYVQVIRIPQYANLTITSPGTIVAVPWGAPTFGGADPSAPERRRGGVVGILATNIINNSSINANQAGFRGGTIENTTSTAGATFYTDFRTTDPALSAEKGEGIAGYRTDYDAAALGGRYGRGAPANGGGGGNAHNSGGGGGANGGNPANWFRGAGVMNDFTGGCGNPGAWVLDPNYIANGNALTNSAGGGSGGYTYSSANLNACTVGPSYPAGFIATGVPAAAVSNSTWGGDYRDATGGLGGRPLASTSMQSQIFFGGGGGAGDGNNTSNADGGDGGGIVFLVVTNSITGTGTIQANGENGANTNNTHNDAPGGGGGGGTVLIQAGTIANTTTLNANGGSGGRQLITGAEAEGPGGGGGGGVISVNATTDSSTKTILGGANGQTDSSSLTEFKANGATSGNTGSILAISVNLNSSVCQADLQVNMSINNTTPTVGDNVTFTITAQNNGYNNATGVKVQDVLPAGYTFVSASTVTGSWTTPDWTIGNLANGATVTLTIVAKVNATGSYLNTATISTSSYDPISTNNSSSVTPTVNHLPVAINDAYTAAEDNTVTLNPLALDTDADGDALTITSINGTALTGGVQTIAVPNGTVSISASGIITFTPVLNFNSATAVSFPYVISDGHGGTATANQLITVTSVNDAPVANNDTKTTNEDTAVTIDVTANDTDADGTINKATVDLDPATPGIQTTFSVTGQGTYTVN
ncbi:DUF11 domain-containing protein, partial [Flavobacterium sp. JLP]|uniref:Ig-like domain-containing protein n=2 Tax=unclassified Flavobacterium TaxID=196869 RepID=UPI00188BFF5B